MSRAFQVPLLIIAASSLPAGGLGIAGQALDRQVGSIEVRLQGEPFATVVTDGAPFPYVYPLFAPGGVRVTRGFPMDPRPGEADDHPHHRSMWIAHGSVNGVDFWHAGERPGTIVTDARRSSSETGATWVELDLRWLADTGAALLCETRTYGFQGTQDERWIDVTSRLRALADPVVFGDTKEGTFALRLHPALRLQGAVAGGKARNSAGDLDADVWGKRAHWVHYFGPVENQPVGVAIFDHPTNPRHPTWWHARDYGLVAANPFGAHDFEGAPPGTGDLLLGPGETLALRYRVYLHRGERSAEDLDQLERQFAAPARALWDSGERLAAVATRRSEISASAEPGALRSELIDWLVLLRHYDAALVQIDQLQRPDPRRATVLHALGRFEEARAALERDNPAHALLLVDTLAALGRLAEWDGALESAAALLGEGHTEVLVLRGQAHARAGRHAQALAAFRAALAREPQHSAALFGLGRSLVASGARAEGLELLARHRHLTPLLDQLDFAWRGLELAPLHAPNWAGLGDAQRALGRLDDAEASYARALQLARDEDLGPIALRAARLFADDRDALERALEVLVAARARVDDPRLSVRAADLLMAADRPSEALVHLLHAEALRPRDAAIAERLQTARSRLAGARKP